jgi:hypothetical protein
VDETLDAFAKSFESKSGIKVNEFTPATSFPSPAVKVCADLIKAG